MNKGKAKAAAEAFTGTWGDLVAIAKSSTRAGASKSAVNPSLTHAKAVEVLTRAAELHDPNEAVEVWVFDPYSRTVAKKHSGHFATVCNIFRECGS